MEQNLSEYFWRYSRILLKFLNENFHSIEFSIETFKGNFIHLPQLRRFGNLLVKWILIATGVFTLKTRSHYAKEIFPLNNLWSFWIMCLGKIVLKKRSFQNIFRQPCQLFKLKSVYEKLRFRDGLVWTVGLTVATKLRFQIFTVNGANMFAI